MAPPMTDRICSETFLPDFGVRDFGPNIVSVYQRDSYPLTPSSEVTTALTSAPLTTRLRSYRKGIIPPEGPLPVGLLNLPRLSPQLQQAASWHVVSLLRLRPTGNFSAVPQVPVEPFTHNMTSQLIFFSFFLLLVFGAYRSSQSPQS
jgi:hypothetical protein